MSRQFCSAWTRARSARPTSGTDGAGAFQPAVGVGPRPQTAQVTSKPAQDLGQPGGELGQGWVVLQHVVGRGVDTEHDRGVDALARWGEEHFRGAGGDVRAAAADLGS